jgi:multidrug efflux pump subunit AcrB
VVLTAAAAVLAMVPLASSVFWGPMAIAIMGGLIVGTVLTLVFVPALYAAWFKVGRLAEDDPSMPDPRLASRDA